ncbi:hypothetical protein L6R52_34610 [Myxococcota bacterium]|nr:hypothetical protein [Myxococcota bacterium]
MRPAGARATLVLVTFVASAPRLASADPPPLDITDSAMAARLRDRVAAEWAVPSQARHPRWFSGDVAPEVVLTPRFVYVRDRALSLPTPPWFRDDAYVAAFELVRAAFTAHQPDRARLVLVFTTFSDGGGSLFYLPLANDVAGLGDGKPTELFDDTPGSVLDGVAWLGDVDTLEAAGDAFFREAFIHEIAHRWSAYASVDRPDVPRDVLRGRQRMHWSFLVDAGTSPMEGNTWVPGADRWTWQTSFETPPSFRFSALDQYLMGLLPAEAVPPTPVITDWSVIEPAGMTIARETAPAHRLEKAVVLRVNTRTEITIDEIVEASGPRVPGAADGRVTWPIGIVLLSNGLDRATFEELVRLDQRISELVRDFERATEGRMVLDVAIEGAGTIDFGEPCTTVDVCDRTRADRCVPIRSGGEPVCTRTCADDADCGPGFCCGAVATEEPEASAPLVCVAGDRCVPPGGPGTPDLDRPDAGPSGPALDEGARDGGACTCTTRGDASLWSLLVAALLAVRLAGSRRGSRGSPG